MYDLFVSLSFFIPLLLLFLGQFYYGHLQAVKIKRAIEAIPHFCIKNVKTTIEGYSKLSYSIHWLSTDVIIMDKTIILITHHDFWGVPFGYQPTYQFFFDENIAQKIAGVSLLCNDTYLQYYGDKLFLKGGTKMWFLNGTIECNLKIDPKKTDIMAILQKYHIIAYP
jgi:hypothetical protein